MEPEKKTEKPGIFERMRSASLTTKKVESKQTSRPSSSNGRIHSTVPFDDTPKAQNVALKILPDNKNFGSEAVKQLGKENITNFNINQNDNIDDNTTINTLREYTEKWENALNICQKTLEQVFELNEKEKILVDSVLKKIAFLLKEISAYKETVLNINTVEEAKKILKKLSKLEPDINEVQEKAQTISQKIQTQL